jgi:hypothetical protein
MKRDERKATGRRTSAERKLAAHFDSLKRHRELLREDRQNITREWCLIRRLVIQHPELKRHVLQYVSEKPFGNEIPMLRLVVNNSPKRPAGKVMRHRPSQSDDGPEAA